MSIDPTVSTSEGGRPRLSIVVSHPIQYHAPLFRRLAKSHVLDLSVEFLSDHGLRPTYDPGFQEEIRYDVPLDEGFTHRRPRNWAPDPSIDRPLGLVHPSLLTGGLADADVILMHGYAHASMWLAASGRMLRRKPYMIRGESRADYEVTMPRGRRMLKRCSVGPLVRGASACLAIGIFNKKFYQDYAVQEERIVMAPYSVDNDFFQMGDHERRDVRVRVLSELGMDPTKPTVLFAAKMVTWKRPEDVLLACQNLKSEVNILMVGAGPILADLKSRYAVTTNIAFLGFLNQQALRNYYAAADVFVLPSDFEPWGLGVNEAMAAGCYPIVSSAVGCAPDLVEPSTSALFPPGDVDKLAQLLGEAIEQLGDREWAVRCRGVIDAHGIESTARGIELGTLASLKGV